MTAITLGNYPVFPDGNIYFAKADLQFERYLEKHGFAPKELSNEELDGNYNLYMIYDKDNITVELVFSVEARQKAGDFLRRMGLEKTPLLWKFAYRCIESLEEVF